MKKLLNVLTLIAISAICSTSKADIYISGHADIGVGFEGGGLHLHLHAEDALGLFGGGSALAGEYDPGDLMIGVPAPSIARPTGPQWDFLAGAAGDPIWFLPQSSDSNKPFLGMGTEELSTLDGWSTITWTFNSRNTISGDASAFSLWQNDQFGAPIVRASTLQPTGAGNSWVQAAFSHDHFNFGFSGEGIYDINFTVTGINSGSGSITAGTYSDTASFRFVTGSAIAAVPEPSSLLLAGAVLVGGLFHRRRASSKCA